MREARAYADERDERGAEMVDALLILVSCALGAWGDGGADGDVVFGGYGQARGAREARESWFRSFADGRAGANRGWGVRAYKPSGVCDSVRCGSRAPVDKRVVGG